MGSMHGQVSLAAVSQISVIHQAMNGCNKHKDSLKYKILINERSNKFQQQVFIYSRPIAGIRAKMERVTTYLQTSKWHVKNIFMHLGFKYHTDQRALYQLRTLIQRSGTVLTRQPKLVPR